MSSLEDRLDPGSCVNEGVKIGEGMIPRARRRTADGSAPKQWTDIRDAAEGTSDRPFKRAESVADATFDLDLSRRQFLALIAAGAGASALSACRKPLERIYPYHEMPEHVIPGRPLFFATALECRGFARGALVESHTGRPTKIEGNPEHPDSLGATDVSMQAEILSLYDADRSQAVKREGEISSWNAFYKELYQTLRTQESSQGEGIRLLTRTITSPTLAAQIGAFLERFPKARWHQYEPFGGDERRAGARLAFGRPVHSRYLLENADAIVSLDADFLALGPGGLRYARDFSRRRKPENGAMCRLYAVEPTPSKTGALADHRLAIPDSDVAAFAAWLAHACGAAVHGTTHLPESIPARWARAVAKDLLARRGRCVVIPGDWQSPSVHALAHAANHALGAFGRVVEHTSPVEANPEDQRGSLGELCSAMEAGSVDLLLMLEGNPAYDAPIELSFASLLKRVPRGVHLSLYDDETSALCRWHLPAAHPLERWSDSRAFDGTVSIVQPMIAPLYEGRSGLEILVAAQTETPPSAHDLLRQHWSAASGRMDFRRFWRQSLDHGVLEGTRLSPLRLAAPRPIAVPELSKRESLELVLRPDPTVDDGSAGNNAWLQELPKPFTRLCWDNAALLSPVLAERLGVSDGDIVALSIGGRELKSPAVVIPGQSTDTVAIAVGYGRGRAGRWGSGAGVDAYPLRPATSWASWGLALRRTGEHRDLAVAQVERTMAGREPVQELTQEGYRNLDRALGAQDPRPEESLYSPHKEGDHAWGMAIDLGSCIGCNACVVACQAENNIPAIGREEVKRGRLMHWIRIDGYFEGSPEEPKLLFQPVPCMHCEDAPCELVCPVEATVHDNEGLNEMVYNRCIGTRYCSNNCPYKVRRFNFFHYSESDDPARKLGYNPDVTVRARGVMEKCTYCVQRIKEAEIQSELTDKAIVDGGVKTACQAACPAEAIVFGDLKDAKSKVSRLKALRRDYGLLAELGTRPRTSYLARVWNPNPELA